MGRKLYKTYKKILDEKLKNSTFLIIIICFLIVSVWIIVPNNSEISKKNNILEIGNIFSEKNDLDTENIIEINWKKYKVYFEEIKL